MLILCSSSWDLLLVDEEDGVGSFYFPPTSCAISDHDCLWFIESILSCDGDLG